MGDVEFFQLRQLVEAGDGADPIRLYREELQILQRVETPDLGDLVLA